jgi:ribosomal protein S18 acetylase RimI-like enzyme
MGTTLRNAHPADFDYCATLYFAGIEKTNQELNVSMSALADNFRHRWQAAEVRIIIRDGIDIGWLQSSTQDGSLFLAQIFVDPAFQRQGFGTEVMNSLIQEATVAGQDVTLGVVKTNPARRLYERLGFCVTHEDERKLYMRRALAVRAETLPNRSVGQYLGYGGARR